LEGLSNEGSEFERVRFSENQCGYSYTFKASVALQEKGPTNPMDTGNCEKKKKKRKERETEKENKNWQLWQPGCKVRAWGAPKTHNRHPFPCSPFFNPATPSSPGYGPGWTPPPSTHRSPPRSAAVAWGTALGELN
jgi:hypothetical protein